VTLLEEGYARYQTFAVDAEHTVIDGYLQSFKYFPKDSAKLSQLTLSGNYQSSADVFLKEHGSGDTGVVTVGIHVRKGDRARTL
jgi:hypothetical protein